MLLTHSSFDIHKFNVLMFTINLHNLQFNSFHGVHDEEKVLGAGFEVNVSLSFDASGKVGSLDETVNYVSVYEIITRRMSVATPLLETLAQELTEEIHDLDNRINSISVSIEKKNPPISNMHGTVSVNYTKEF